MRLNKKTVNLQGVSDVEDDLIGYMLGSYILYLVTRTGVGLIYFTSYRTVVRDKVMIGRGSCINIIYESIVERIGLKVEPHTQPYVI